MSNKKAKSGSRRKCDTARHKVNTKRQRAKRREIRDQNAAAKEIDRVHDEAVFMQRNFGQRDAPEVCPLCNQPITEEDMKGNVHKIRIHRQEVKVHRTCPGEENGG